MMRDTSPYNSNRTKVILSVSAHYKDKFFTLAKMYGVSGNFLFQLIVDELFFDPIAPTLNKRLESCNEKIQVFFRKHQPEWKNRT